jgi:hypothetical protein
VVPLQRTVEADQPTSAPGRESATGPEFLPSSTRARPGRDDRGR